MAKKQKGKYQAPQGPLFELHEKLKLVHPNFIEFICSELQISRPTYHRWLIQPERYDHVQLEKVLKITHDIINDARLLVARMFKMIADAKQGK